MRICSICVLACCGLQLRAASPPIGALTTLGTVVMDNYDVRGNGTIFDGSTVETDKYPSELILRNGSRFELYQKSRAKVYADCVVLERGMGQVQTSRALRVIVDSVGITPVGPSSTVLIVLADPKSVQIGAVKGQAEVWNASGFVVGKILAGSTLTVDPRPGGPTQVTGKVREQDGHYLLSDFSTDKTFELQGQGLESTVGRCISALGSADLGATPAPGAAELIYLAAFNEISCTKDSASRGTTSARACRLPQQAVASH